jgi:imidazolonepropionase-like amidohydrolase
MPSDALVLANATIYPSPSDPPITDGIVLIRDGKIAGVGASGQVVIPQSADTLDCTGLSVAAGFWNCHVHFFERKWANAAEIPAQELARQFQDTYTRYGFTSVFDLSSVWENTRILRDRVASGEVSGPRIRSTGLGLLPVGAGIPPEAVLQFMGLMKSVMPEIAGEEQARDAAQRLLADGVDAIKFFVSSPSKAGIPEETMRAGADEFHRAGKPVFVHPNSAADIVAALHAGADVIGHTTPRSGAWTDALLDAMVERGVALTPTLTLWQYYLRHDRVSVQDQVVSTAVDQLRAWHKRRGTILFGTDLGAVDPDPAPEYALMTQAGMTFHDILASLTTAPAEKFGESSRLGRVVEGFDADLVIFHGDLAGIRHTIRAGQPVYTAG